MSDADSALRLMRSGRESEGVEALSRLVEAAARRRAPLDAQESALLVPWRNIFSRSRYPESRAMSVEAVQAKPKTIDGEIVLHSPSHIWIEPTNRCNTRCTHCGHFYSQFGGDMDHDLYHKIRDTVLDGVERAELIGYGEPFMAKHFQEMFDDCVTRGIQIYTTTNGILLRDDERVSKVVRNDVTLCLSIDGAKKESFETVRPYIKWHKMLETLECIKRNADAAGDAKKFRLRFNFCAMKQNIPDLPDLVRLAHQYGADEIFVLPLSGEEMFTKLTGQSLHDSPDIVSPAYLEALELAAELGIALQIPASFRELILQGAERRKGVKGRLQYVRRKVSLAKIYMKGKGVSDTYKRWKKVTPKVKSKVGVTYCNMPWNDAYFAADGTVFPCCIMTEKLGDMKTQDWNDIWNGQGYRNLRRTIHGWNPSAVCRGCGLPGGINGGDGLQYQKHFSRFVPYNLPLDSEDLILGDGCHELELNPDGSASHVWQAAKGAYRLRMKDGAQFLRIEILIRGADPGTNPGTATINSGEPEYFDNTCDVFHVPLSNVTGDWIELTLEMENGHHVGEDKRELALAIKAIRYMI
ncbi:hypothetical protein BH09SUM1_BH09SUM1_12360 [soil metagenome]